MRVDLGPDLAALVRQKVDAGQYPDIDAVMREALRLLDEHDRLRWLRAALAEADAQIERGEFVEWTPDLMEQLTHEADEMIRQGVQPHPDVCP